MRCSWIFAVAALAAGVSAVPLGSRTLVAADAITSSIGDLTERDLALDLAHDRNYYVRRDADPPGDPEIDPEDPLFHVLIGVGCSGCQGGD